MSFGPTAIRGVPATGSGTVNFRMRRASVLAEFHKGRLDRQDVCDAHPELLRAAQQLGEPTRVDCPICAEDDTIPEPPKVVLVTYVFGPRLPKFGRCISQKGELAKLDRRAEELTAYVVEVCPACGWNHLARALPIGGRGARRR